MAAGIPIASYAEWRFGNYGITTDKSAYRPQRLLTATAFIGTGPVHTACLDAQ